MQLAAFTNNHFPLGQAAMLVNEGLPRLHRRAAGAPLRRRWRQDRRHPRHGVQGRQRRHRAQSLSYKLRKLLALGRCDGAVHRPVRRGRPPRAASRTSSTSATSSSSARRTAPTGICDPAGKDVVDVWGALGGGIAALHEGPRHRRRRVHRRLPRQELLGAGHEVVGIDNFSKYGPGQELRRPPGLSLRRGRRKDVDLLTELVADCDQFVAGAAMIGGISYFHEFAYDLLAENERILAATFDAAIAAHQQRPPAEDHRRLVVHGLRVHRPSTRRPRATQRTLAAAHLDLRLPEARRRVLRQGAWEQYRLPYTIVRPFNCVGIGERRALRDRGACPAT